MALPKALAVAVEGDDMDEILFGALNLLFKDFEQYGNYSDGEIFKVLAMVAIRDMLEMDTDGYIKDCDIRHIQRATECIVGVGCLMPLKTKCC